MQKPEHARNIKTRSYIHSATKPRHLHTHKHRHTGPLMTPRARWNDSSNDSIKTPQLTSYSLSVGKSKQQQKKTKKKTTATSHWNIKNSSIVQTVSKALHFKWWSLKLHQVRLYCFCLVLQCFHLHFNVKCSTTGPRETKFHPYCVFVFVWVDDKVKGSNKAQSLQLYESFLIISFKLVYLFSSQVNVWSLTEGRRDKYRCSLFSLSSSGALIKSI